MKIEFVIQNAAGLPGWLFRVLFTFIACRIFFKWGYKKGKEAGKAEHKQNFPSL